MPLLYNVGQIVAEYNQRYIRATPPRVTPADLRPLIAMLREATDFALEHARSSAVYFEERYHRIPNAEPLDQLKAIDRELRAWSGRLANYEVSVAPDVCPDDDAECTLWTVTAPLFFGFYDGPLGVSPPASPDLKTVFMLANQLDELRSWSIDQTGPGALWRDVKTTTPETAKKVSEVVVGTMRAMGEAAGAVAGAATSGVLSGLGVEPKTLGIVAGVGLGWWILSKKKKRKREREAAA